MNMLMDVYKLKYICHTHKTTRVVKAKTFMTSSYVIFPNYFSYCLLPEESFQKWQKVSYENKPEL